jgi:hypothetical protein
MATVLTISFPKRAVSSSEHVDLKGGVIGEWPVEKVRTEDLRQITLNLSQGFQCPGSNSHLAPVASPFSDIRKPNE